MKKHSFCAVLLLGISAFLDGHGFSVNTLVSHGDHFRSISSFERAKSKPYLSSYDTGQKRVTCKKVTTLGKSRSNCYCNVYCNDARSDAIACTPTQKFYDVASQSWVYAFQLSPGDVLQSMDGTVGVQKIEFVAEPLDVCSVAVPHTHTLFVGTQKLLAHNMFFPSLVAGLGVSFGSGVAAGGSAGSFFGPITFAGGIVLGGVVGIGVHLIARKKVVEYQIDFDVERIGNYVELNEQHKQQKSKRAEQGPSVTGGNTPDPDDDDARDGLKSIEDLVKEASPKARQTKKANFYQYEKIGNYADAVKDFKSVVRSAIKDISSAKDGSKLLGKLADGSKVLVRNVSSRGPDYVNGVSTLEVQALSGMLLKFRYI